MMGLVLALAATPLAGYALCRPFVRDTFFAERLAWSLAAGLIAQAFLVMALTVVRPGADLSAPLIILTAPLLTPLLFRSSAANQEAWRSLPASPLTRISLAVAAAGVALFGLAALSEPMWTIDYLAVWGLKAKTIFLTASMPLHLFHDPASGSSHAEYPLLLPLDLAALAAWTRGWDDRLLAVLYPLFQAAAAAAVFGFLARRSQALGGAVGAALVAWFFPLYSPVNVGTADIPLAFGSVLLATALLDAFERDSPSVRARLVLSSLFCAGTKLEGALLAAVGSVIWILSRPRGRSLLRTPLALLLPVAVHGAILRWLRGGATAKDFDLTLLAPARWGELVGRTGEAVTTILKSDGAAVLPLLAILAFLFLTRRSAEDPVLALLALQAGGYVFACALSVISVAWVVSTSFGRIIGTLFPALALVLGARLARSTDRPPAPKDLQLL